MADPHEPELAGIAIIASKTIRRQNIEDEDEDDDRTKMTMGRR